MWNISISVVAPIYHKSQKLFHEVDDKDTQVVIIANGGGPTTQMPYTHFSATESNNTLVNTKPGKTLEHHYLVPQEFKDTKFITEAADMWKVKIAHEEAKERFDEVSHCSDLLQKEIKVMNEQMLKLKVKQQNLKSQMDLLELELEGCGYC